MARRSAQIANFCGDKPCRYRFIGAGKVMMKASPDWTLLAGESPQQTVEKLVYDAFKMSRPVTG